MEEANDRVANRTYSDEAALNYAVQHAYYVAQRFYGQVKALIIDKTCSAKSETERLIGIFA